MLLACGYRIDLLVSGHLIVETKSVETVLPIHQAQTLTYIGLLINFNVTKLENGIKRLVPLKFFVSFVLFAVSIWFVSID